jgi:hypothetical protein
MIKAGTIYISIECPFCSGTNVSRYITSEDSRVFVCKCLECGHDFEDERYKSELIPDYNICRKCEKKFYAEHDYPYCHRCNNLWAFRTFSALTIFLVVCILIRRYVLCI